MCGWVSEKGGRGEESQGQVAPGEQAQLEPRVNPWGGKTQIVLSVSFLSQVMACYNDTDHACDFLRISTSRMNINNVPNEYRIGSEFLSQ